MLADGRLLFFCLLDLLLGLFRLLFGDALTSGVAGGGGGGSSSFFGDGLGFFFFGLEEDDDSPRSEVLVSGVSVL